ncbi:coiled-coil domain-containing protein [Micromonospora sp. NPDC007230]|uniref:coiled-coil domain-containing protein n=1 Tax=Micromonospora sp. NPDC007230 TaxID=3364237 RepID=UPI0036C8C9A9
MPRTRLIRRRARRALLALLAAAALLLGAGLAPAGPAAAAPSPSAPDEGGSKQLRAALEAAAKGHIEAQARLDNSKRRQVALNGQLKQIELRLVELKAQVGEVAAHSYRVGRLTPVSALLASTDPDSFLQRAAELDVMAQRDSRRLRDLHEAQAEATRAKLALDAEVREQQKQLAILAKKKRDAEIALAKVSSGGSRGFSGGSGSAKPAPRNPDGSWPAESCSVNDPTPADGCITPRTLHMLQQAKAAGYKRYVSCHRSGGGGEHPKGRACDFSAASGGFENVSATGGDKAYGDSLASYLKNNASKLGVMYVIWYRQIWMPNTGWRSYSGGGSPAADHTNHVHVSMY